MKEIILTNGNKTLVDDEDYDRLSVHVWHEFSSEIIKTKYAYTYLQKTKHCSRCNILMHRMILNLSRGDGIKVDHKDRNGLNNQKSNLRTATYSQNVCNVGVRQNNKIGLKGISFFKGKYEARIGINKEKKYLGRFDTKEEAAAAYDKAAIELHGEFSCTNGFEEMYVTENRRKALNKGYGYNKKRDQWYARTSGKHGTPIKHLGAFKTEAEAKEAVRLDRVQHLVQEGI